MRSLAAIAVLSSAALLIAAGVAARAWRAAGPPDAPPVVVSIDRDGLRYQYNALSGRQFLFDMNCPAADRIDLAPSRPGDALRLRRLLERQLSISDLDALHEPYRETADSLRGMGYL